MRSTQSVTGSWRRHGNNGRFVASKPLDVETATLQPVFGAVRFKLVEGLLRSQLPDCRTTRYYTTDTSVGIG